MILALDLSTVKTGFSFGGQNDGAPKGGVWRMPGAGADVFDRTLGGIYESVLMMARAIKAERVCIEAPLLLNDSEHGAAITMALVQLTGAARAGAHNAGCLVKCVAVSTVRKHFIGIGNLPSKKAKQAVMDRCTLFGWPYEDDNQADSNAVWSWGMSTYYPKWSPRSTPLFAKR